MREEQRTPHRAAHDPWTAFTGCPQPTQGEQEDADAVAQEQGGRNTPVGGTRQRDCRQARNDRRRKQRRHEELAGERKEVGLAAERQRAK